MKKLRKRYQREKEEIWPDMWLREPRGYEGERLNDMLESIREHGILNPVIVLKTDDGYEMLSGHNRANTAKIAGLSEVPAIIKVGLSESEAYVYVIETNLMQRSFAELLPSEKRQLWRHTMIRCAARERGTT